MFNKANLLKLIAQLKHFCCLTIRSLPFWWFQTSLINFTDNTEVVKNLLKHPLAYQLHLLFMEFKVNVDKMKKQEKVKCAEGKWSQRFRFYCRWLELLCSKKKIFIFSGESSKLSGKFEVKISRGNSQMIGRLMGHKEGNGSFFTRRNPRD